MKSLLSILAAAPIPLALCALAGPQDPSPAPRSLLDAVPEDAICFAQATDLDGLRAAAGKNAWGRMLRDAELAPFLDELRSRALADIGEGAADPEAVFDLFLASLRGSLVFFAAGSDLDRPDFGFLIDPGEGRASFEEFIAAVDQGDDAAKSYEEYGGVSLAVADGEDGASANVEFEVDGVWGAAEAASRGGAIAVAQGIIDRLRGSAEANIAAAPLFAAARAGAPPGRIEFFADAQRLMAAVQEEDDLDEQAQRALDLIGLQHLSWLHGSLDLGEGEELDLHLRMALPSEGYLADWLAALGPLPQRLAALGPASALGAALYNVDLFAIYESVWDLVGDVDPEAYEQARSGLENGLQSSGLDPEGDFLAQLTGEFASFSVPVPEEEFTAVTQALDQVGLGALPEALRVGEVYVVGLEDAGAVELFFEEVLGVFGGFVGLSAASIRSEDYQGFQVQSLELPVGMSLNWCFTDDFVAGSLYPSALRSALALHGKEDAPSILTNKHFGPHIEQHARASVLGLAPAAGSVRMLLSMLGMVSGMQASATWDNAGAGEATDWPFAGMAMPDPSLADRYLEGTLIFKLERGPAEVAMAFMAR